MSKLNQIGACLRRKSLTEWCVLDDAGHTPVGADRVEIVGKNRVRLHYDFTAHKVVTFSATPDEQFAAANVRCGASVGLRYADIYFYMGASSVPVDPGLLAKAGANIWVHGLFTRPEEAVIDWMYGI